jgi:hypothetical protein
MARTKKGSLPSYRLHKPTGQAIVTPSDGQGGRRDYYLGAYGTPESKTEYTRQLELWQSGRPLRPSGSDITIQEMLLAFQRHSEQWYRRADGSKTDEVHKFKLVMGLVRPGYGLLPAREFGPKTSSRFGPPC